MAGDRPIMWTRKIWIKNEKEPFETDEEYQKRIKKEPEYIPTEEATI